ncbi:MAG: EI24 domain-containing protein [Sphingopyxis sp.]|uniref:EI24 domain-containing protein n=1 Tax=Sphingopyxis sp. TaxID=1908224 RepID=UPI002AB8322C|nr:EI24 domain-containing protein [Sphingopyxis sp.]MDZ3832004.1 EI24 domain-containing protein [Sphingopyxis sp.]
MVRVLPALFLALRDVASPRGLAILLQSLALTLLILAAAGTAIFLLARHLLQSEGWLSAAQADMAGVLVIVLVIAGSWLLFRAVAIMVIGLFADAIVADIEGRHYPVAASRAVDVGWRRTMTLALASLARLILGNILALPLYILLLVTGIGTPLLALAVNAMLLGRDLDAMIGARHPGQAPLERGTRWSLGLLSAASFLVPVVNLLAPIVSTAMAVHLFHMRDLPMHDRDFS